MAATVRELRKWLGRFPATAVIAVDSGGLTLLREGTTQSLEIGGTSPNVCPDCGTTATNPPDQTGEDTLVYTCADCGADWTAAGDAEGPRGMQEG